MADVRYPVGRFQLPSQVTPEIRNQWIEAIAALPDQVRQALSGLSEQQLDTPYREGGWTVRQVVHHLADSHMNAYIRYRLGLTEQQPTIKPYDEAAWADLPDAKSAPLAPSLAMLEGIHDRWVRLARNVDGAALARTVHHPESGVLSLDTLLGLYAWHGRHHTAHILSVAK